MKQDVPHQQQINNIEQNEQNVSNDANYTNNNDESTFNPRQNKYQNYPNPQISYDNTIDAENDILYNKIKKKDENTSNTSYINSKKNNLLHPRPNIVGQADNSDFYSNQYFERMSSINSKNPNNRI